LYYYIIRYCYRRAWKERILKPITCGTRERDLVIQREGDAKREEREKEKEREREREREREIRLRRMTEAG
jgi:hypothetical protein